MSCINFAQMARDLVSIQQRSDSGDAYGGTDVTWAELSSVWAIIEPTTGREVFKQSDLQSRVTHKFTIRYIASLKDTTTASEARISFDDRIFPVEYVRNLHVDGKRHGVYYQELYCVEGYPTND